MKKIIPLILCLFLVGCASVGKLYERGKYTETVCTKRLFKKEVCKEVTKTGLHISKMITAKGTSAKFAFKDGVLFLRNLTAKETLHSQLINGLFDAEGQEWLLWELAQSFVPCFFELPPHNIV